MRKHGASCWPRFLSRHWRKLLDYTDLKRHTYTKDSKRMAERPSKQLSAVGRSPDQDSKSKNRKSGYIWEYTYREWLPWQEIRGEGQATEAILLVLWQHMKWTPNNCFSHITNYSEAAASVAPALSELSLELASESKSKLAWMTVSVLAFTIELHNFFYAWHNLLLELNYIWSCWNSTTYTKRVWCFETNQRIILQAPRQNFWSRAVDSGRKTVYHFQIE